MKHPRKRFLVELAKALHEAEHQNVASHVAAGLLWALYPQWFDNVWKKEEA